MHMKTDDVLYTDGHDVVVTYSAIQVKKKWYKLNGITKHGLSILGPERLPFVVLLLIGTALSLLGLFDGAQTLLGTTELAVYDFSIHLNQLLFWIGIGLLALTAVLMLAIPERYAVSITTAEGEKNLIVSTQKEYVTQIIKALNEAFLARVGSKAGMIKKSRRLAI
jgi:hypothetical protein